ncbi:uncharacterized protein LOC120849135 [Ixodes scapularis]|uniref:uncharacterized protein LOC120849135 n=1 Tax=Ixodes scapularis TaxID=6945 RepID=UPI001A9D245E|nr:uncharacterized protein LOC120849135 [Ixodes scapularis]
MTSPRTMCNSLVGPQIRGVTLQWNLVNATTSEILRYPLPVAFVVQMRTELMASNDADAWTTLGTGRHGLVPITNLSRERHQFRVTAVTRLGPKGRPLTTPWTVSSEDNLKAPDDVRVTKSSASGYSITSRLSWSYQESDVPSCNYVIDLLPDKGTVPSAHFRVSKPYDLFSFDMGQLAFSTNYDLHIRATDTLGEKKSLPATTSFLTPSCLDCYHFNFSLCAQSAGNVYCVLVYLG